MEIKDALVLVDVQNGVMNQEGFLPDAEKIIDYAVKRAEEYKNCGKPVIIIRHTDEELKEGSRKWQNPKELNDREGFTYISKTHPNAFYKTDLEKVLRKHNVESLEIAGAETAYCMDATIKFAHGLGFKVFMKKGMHTTSDIGYISQEETRKLYEGLWNGRFLTLTE